MPGMGKGGACYGEERVSQERDEEEMNTGTWSEDLGYPVTGARINSKCHHMIELASILDACCVLVIFMCNKILSSLLCSALHPNYW